MLGMMERRRGPTIGDQPRSYIIFGASDTHVSLPLCPWDAIARHGKHPLPMDLVTAEDRFRLAHASRVSCADACAASGGMADMRLLWGLGW